MYRLNPLTQSDAFSADHFYKLRTQIPAIQILPSADDEVRLSPVSKLPQGAELFSCGPGFDSETIKVCCQGQYYFVFVRDLEERPLAFAAC